MSTTEETMPSTDEMNRLEAGAQPASSFAESNAEMMPTWVVALRLLRVAGHLVVGLSILAFLGYWIRNDLPWQRRIVLWWHRKCLKILNVEVEVVGGQPLGQGSLVVSNHISWLDIPVLGSQIPVNFLAKSEVRKWPVIGWLAQTAGTHFIQRRSGRSAEVAQQLAQHFQRGDNILVFPEGTSTDGRSVRRFHPNLFEAAIAAEAHVQPFAITYLKENQAHRFVPFIDDDEFHTHLWQFLKVKKTLVRLTVVDAISHHDHCKASLSRCTREGIIAARKV